MSTQVPAPPSTGAATVRTSPRWLRRVVWSGLVIVLAIALLDLVGWALGISFLTGINPQWTPMKAITAVCFLLSVAAVACVQGGAAGRWCVRLTVACGAAVSLVGLTTAATYLLESQTGAAAPWFDTPGLDLFLGPVTRMAIITAMIYSVFGVILALLAAGGRRASGIAHAALAPLTLMAYMVLVGYIFSVPAFYDWMNMGVALNTGVAFCALFIATFCVWPDTWLMRVLTGDEAGAIMARRLVPPLMILPVVVGWLRIAGERAGLFDSAMGVALVAAVYVVCFFWLVWLTAAPINRTDRHRRRAEEKLWWSERRYRSFIEVTNQWAWVTNPTGLVVEDIPALRAFTGQTCEQARGNGWADALHPDDVHRTLEVWNRAVSTKTPYETEYRMRRHDGVYRVLLARGVPILDDRGSVIEWVGTCIDVTERRAAEQDLRRSREDLDRAQSVGQIGSWRLDVRHNVLTWSDENHRIFGVPKGTPMSYEFFLSTIHPDDRQHVDSQWAAGLRGEPYDIEHRILVDGRVKWVREKAYLEFDEAGRLLGGFGITQDITARKQAEDELRRTVDELARSNKDLEQFAYVASHDLQEPLRMVTGFMDLLKQKYEGRLDTTADQYIHFATDGAHRMQSLVTDLLAYSRVGAPSGPEGKAEGGQALQRALANLQARVAESGARVTFDPLPVVRADLTQLAQVFQNLLGNALKFHGDEPPRVHVSVRRDEADWVFSVADNGIGIEPQFQDRIFMIFQRLHARDKYPGSGIGLAICKKIIERHGGRIWVESQVGQGATFHFTLPAEENA
jgi:PAS domain S-box-containing protein